jgi:hypothetical protein
LYLLGEQQNHLCCSQDFILFRKGVFKVLRTTKDNTGKKKYVEQMVFPTLEVRVVITPYDLLLLLRT